MQVISRQEFGGLSQSHEKNRFPILLVGLTTAITPFDEGRDCFFEALNSV